MKTHVPAQAKDPPAAGNGLPEPRPASSPANAAAHDRSDAPREDGDDDAEEYEPL